MVQICILAIGGFGGFDSFTEHRLKCDFEKKVNENSAEEYCWNYPSLQLPKEDNNLKDLCAVYVPTENIDQKSKDKHGKTHTGPKQSYIKIIPRISLLFSMVFGLTMWYFDKVDENSLSLDISEPENCKNDFYILSFQYETIFRNFMVGMTITIILNCVCVWLLDFTMNKQFLLYGVDLFKYFVGLGQDGFLPHCNIFPISFGCNYPDFDSNGAFKLVSGLCSMNVNFFNQFFYGLLWYFIAVQTFVTIVTILFWLFMPCCPLRLRYKFIGITMDDYNVYKLRYVCRKITFYEYFLLSNMVKTFKDQFTIQLIQTMYEHEYKQQLEMFNENMG